MQTQRTTIVLKLIIYIDVTCSEKNKGFGLNIFSLVYVVE